MSNVKLSIIVPICRSESYIERCVRSLLEQTITDGVEFIFIDDASPDRSLEILKEVMADYPERFPQIRILHHRENLGASAARTTGLHSAVGKYVAYCDSDDWVDTDMYGTMLARAEETDADIVACGFIEEYEARRVVNRRILPRDNMLCIRRMLGGTLPIYNWNKLIRRSLYIDNGIEPVKGIDMWDDMLMMIPLFFHARTIEYVSGALYHFNRENTESYTNAPAEATRRDMIEAISRMEQFIADNGLEELRPALNCKKLMARLHILRYSGDEHKARFGRIFPEANREIRHCTGLHLYWRLALKIHQFFGLRPFNAMDRFAKFLKS